MVQESMGAAPEVPHPHRTCPDEASGIRRADSPFFFLRLGPIPAETAVETD